MREFNLKLLRDLVAAKGVALGVALVIFLGVSFYGAAYMAFQNLKGSYDYSYEKLRFADFTVSVADVPADTITALGGITDVTGVAGRLNIDLPLYLPGGSRAAVLARVITLPAPGRPAVNDVKVEEGSYFSSGNGRGLLVERSFADYHGLGTGDNLILNINGQPVAFAVQGIVSSPEYIFAAKSRQSLLTSPEVFGVVFAPQETIQQLTGTGNLNEFCFTVAARSDRQAAIDAAQSLLGGYNILDVVTREDQASNAALSLDLQEFQEMGEIFPLLFLIIGGLATYILLTRMVLNQRSQIGMMRALGYTRRRVMLHYLEFALIIGLVGSVAGSIAGYLLSGVLTRFYITILGLPYTLIDVHWLAVEEGLFIGVLACFIAGILPARAAAKLSPAEAMRPPPPVRGRRSLLESLLPFAGRLSSGLKMPLRNIFRNRNRSLSLIIGVAFGISLVMVSAAFVDSVDDVLDLQFRRIQRYDAQVGFVVPQPAGLADYISGWEGVTEAQPVLQMPVQLQHGDNVYSTILIGMNPSNKLYRLFTPEGLGIEVPTNGILLAGAMRDKLGIAGGDDVTVITTSNRSILTVAGFIMQPMGSPAYMALDNAQALAGGQDIINAVMVSSGASGNISVRSRAAELLPGASVEVTTETEQMVAKLFDLVKTMMWFMLLFGAVLAMVILFTMVTLSIIERRREIASMRTIGESMGNIVRMITIENLCLGILGLIPGLLLGYGLMLYFFSTFQTDLMGFVMVVRARTYFLILGMTVLIVLIAQIPGIRNINRLDLARVIKEQVS